MDSHPTPSQSTCSTVIQDSNYTPSQSITSSDIGPKKFHVAGVEVDFPTKPYKCQLSTMNMAIRGFRHMTNSIIESPTGSGKTLSLICASLAWQKAEAEKLKEVMEKEAAEEEAVKKQREEFLRQYQFEQGRKYNTQEQEKEQFRQLQVTQEEQSQTQEHVREQTPKRREQKGVSYYDDEEDDDFQPVKIVKKMKYFGGQSNIAMSEPTVLTGTEEFSTKNSVQKTSHLSDSESCICMDSKNNMSTLPEEDGAVGLTQSSCNTLNSQATLNVQSEDVLLLPTPAVVKPSVPTIYYCSRTHQQIQQVTRELEKTVYKYAKMTILASREHTCIQGRWKGHSRTELCRKLLDPLEGRGCSYFNNCNMNHTVIDDKWKMRTPWDIEDLVTKGKKFKVCPYFAARDLVPTAEIVFCPYIYIIDPKIRNKMNLNLHGAVILLDEAHNIEDTCREAGSHSVLYDELYLSLKDCKAIASHGAFPEVYQGLITFLQNLLKWMSKQINISEPCPSEKEANTWQGVNAVASFEEFDVNVKTVKTFKDHASFAIAETYKEENKPSDKFSKKEVIASSTVFFLEGLCTVLGFMYDNDMEHIRDYYVVLSKSAIISTSSRTDVTDDMFNLTISGFGTLTDDDIPRTDWGHYLNFLCMNSGVVFQPIASTVRSIVLTSGTLAPLTTFNSELGTTFANELQALHVVDESQVWVGTLGCGPSGKDLHASYNFTELPSFRQELGVTIIEISKIIPFGVLCFLPSYGLLENLKLHWMQSGIWDELQLHKEILCEIRGNRDFLSTIQAYYNSVKKCELGQGKGPLLFAVMRGKVSEGLDFSDNRARGVITVGIPYPHVYDIQVRLKRKYNDANTKRGLKSGSQWYETQAYRALNQALGRCIRHKNDWGALIIIDKRFLTEERHIQGLSKWIRRKVQSFPTFSNLQSSLKNFMNYHNPLEPEDDMLTF